MAEATIRSATPIWREGFDGRRHAMVESSVGRSACRALITEINGAPNPRAERCLECLELVGIDVSLNLGPDRRVIREARVFSDASDRTAAAATVIDLVIDDLRHQPGEGPTDVAIAELLEVRHSLHDIAGKLRRAATRWERP